MYINVTAKAIVTVGSVVASANTFNPICICLCVTNPDGNPRTGMGKDDFDVLPLLNTVEINIDHVCECSQTLEQTGEPRIFVDHRYDGYYLLWVVPVSMPWPLGDVALAVIAKDLSLTYSYGRTLVECQIALLPSPSHKSKPFKKYRKASHKP